MISTQFAARLARRSRMPFARSASTLIVLLATVPTVGAQSVQYTSPAGVVYRALPDTGPVARAQAVLASDPRNVQRRIQLAVAQSGVRQFREAIATLSDGLRMTPDDVMLLRWRGHRHLSVREFTKARADLTRGFALDSTNYGILFHLGVLNFAEGRYRDAVHMFTRAQPLAPDGGERAGSTDWLWMSLSRAGQSPEAAAMLARKPDSLPAPPGYAYVSRLRLYRGEVTPQTLFTAADTADTQVATLNYGVGNWLLVKGDTAGARAAFQRSVASGGWAGFGFIVSELELKRMRGR